MFISSLPSGGPAQTERLTEFREREGRRASMGSTPHLRPLSTPSSSASTATSAGRCIADASPLGSSPTGSAAHMPTASAPRASLSRLRLPRLPRGSACGAFRFSRRLRGRRRGGGGGGVDGEDWKLKSAVDGAEEASGVSSDVIILDVGGMTCGDVQRL